MLGLVISYLFNFHKSTGWWPCLGTYTWALSKISVPHFIIICFDWLWFKGKQIIIRPKRRWQNCNTRGLLPAKCRPFFNQLKVMRMASLVHLQKYVTLWFFPYRGSSKAFSWRFRHCHIKTSGPSWPWRNIDELAKNILATPYDHGIMGASKSRN